MRIRSLLRLFLPALLILSLAPAAAQAQAEGILDVKCNVQGALVFVDGVLLGEAPLLEIVPAGAHLVRVERDSFSPFEQQISLRADTTLEISARLIRTAPGLEVVVDVDDASVFLDGEQVGQGQRVIVDPAPAGQHELRVTSPDYNDWTGKVNLKPGVVTPVEVSLRGSQGMLIVEAQPPARVLMDGRDHGTTPVSIEPVPPGSHGLKLTADGHSMVLQSVVIEPGKTASVEATLVPEGGTIDVRPSVNSARLFLNGVDVGTGRQTVGPLKPGLYSLRVTAAGHTDFIQPVQVDADKKVSVSAKLQSFDYDGGLAGGPPGGRPVTRQPGFWAGIGAGAGAVVAGVIIAAVVVNNQDDPGTDPLQPRPGVDAPGTTVVYTLP